MVGLQGPKGSIGGVRCPTGPTATFGGSFDHLEGSAGEFLGLMGSVGMLKGQKEVQGALGSRGMSGGSHGF